MTTDCNCPVLPDLNEMSADEFDQVIGKPLCCTSCGQELELRCPEGHVHHAPRTRSPNDRPEKTLALVRSCPGCEKPFEPRAYQRRCDDCLAGDATRKCGDCGARMELRQRVCRVCHPAEVKTPTSNRTYSEKTCSCGETFMPTGPRALRCGKCRGGGQA